MHAAICDSAKSMWWNWGLPNTNNIYVGTQVGLINFDYAAKNPPRPIKKHEKEKLAVTLYIIPFNELSDYFS